jgi:ribonuclease PH
MQKGDLAFGVVRAPVAASSVGYLEGIGLALDLCYREDSSARVDLNVVATEDGNIIEIQGTAEGAPVPRSSTDRMLDLALLGIRQLAKIQREVLRQASAPLEPLLLPGGPST